MHLVSPYEMTDLDVIMFLIVRIQWNWKCNRMYCLRKTGEIRKTFPSKNY